jgi:hypothetical protein
MRFITVLCYVTGNEGLLDGQRQFLFLRDNRMFLHQMNVRLVQMNSCNFKEWQKKNEYSGYLVPSYLSRLSPWYTNMPVGTLIKEETGRE